MANYVDNHFEITNLHPEEADCLEVQLATDSFCKFIKPMPSWMSVWKIKDGVHSHCLDECGIPVLTIPGGNANIDAWRQWNWGPSGDIVDCEVERTGNNLSGYFATCWVPLKMSLMEEFALKFPDATITLIYKDEGGEFCGGYLVNKGVAKGWGMDIEDLRDQWGKSIEGWNEMDEEERVDKWESVEDQVIKNVVLNSLGYMPRSNCTEEPDRA